MSVAYTKTDFEPVNLKNNEGAIKNDDCNEP